MTREKWLEHIEAVTGKAAPLNCAAVPEWSAAVREHHRICPDCQDCKAREKSRKRAASRKDREDAYKLAGLVKGRTGLGRVIWE